MQVDNLNTVVSQYNDYGYENNQFCHVSDYILNPVLKHLSQHKSHKILDIGCGNGWLVNELIKNNYDAYGIDASITGIREAKKAHQDRFFVQDISSELLPAEINNMNFKVIISTEVIEHLYNPVSYIRFCRHILTKAGGGKLIITTPYHGYLKNILLAVTDKLDRHYSPSWIGGHIKFWSRKSLSQLLEGEGFVIESFEGCGRFPYLWKSMLIAASIK